MITPPVPVDPAAPVDLTAVIAEIKRVADALVIGNTQVAKVIVPDTAGQDRVMTDPNAPV